MTFPVITDEQRQIAREQGCSECLGRFACWDPVDDKHPVCPIRNLPCVRVAPEAVVGMTAIIWRKNEAWQVCKILGTKPPIDGGVYDQERWHLQLPDGTETLAIPRIVSIRRPS